MKRFVSAFVVLVTAFVSLTANAGDLDVCFPRNEAQDLLHEIEECRYVVPAQDDEIRYLRLAVRSSTTAGQTQAEVNRQLARKVQELEGIQPKSVLIGAGIGAGVTALIVALTLLAQ